MTDIHDWHVVDKPQPPAPEEYAYRWIRQFYNNERINKWLPSFETVYEITLANTKTFHWERPIRIYDKKTAEYIDLDRQRLLFSFDEETILASNGDFEVDELFVTLDGILMGTKKKEYINYHDPQSMLVYLPDRFQPVIRIDHKCFSEEK